MFIEIRQIFILMTGKQLKDKILSYGIELKKVAETLGITPQDLNSKLNAADIKVDFFLKVSRAINKSVYELVDSDSMILSEPTPVYNKDQTLYKYVSLLESQAGKDDLLRRTAQAAIDAVEEVKILVGQTTSTVNGLKEIVEADVTNLEDFQVFVLERFAKAEKTSFEQVRAEWGTLMVERENLRRTGTPLSASRQNTQA